MFEWSGWFSLEERSQSQSEGERRKNEELFDSA